MLALMDQTNEPFVADDQEAVIARVAVDRLRAVAEANQDVNIRFGHDVTVPLPARAVVLFYQVLESMANRIPVSIIPHEAELTTQQAADYLNVSRPFLVSMLESNEIPFRKVGTHRRVKFADLLAYEAASKEKQAEAMKTLADEAKRLKLD